MAGSVLTEILVSETCFWENLLEILNNSQVLNFTIFKILKFDFFEGQLWSLKTDVCLKKIFQFSKKMTLVNIRFRLNDYQFNRIFPLTSSDRSQIPSLKAVSSNTKFREQIKLVKKNISLLICRVKADRYRLVHFHAVGVRYWIFRCQGFFSWISISKMRVNMNLRIITKNHAASVGVRAHFQETCV